jgi:hypothetical protein
MKLRRIQIALVPLLAAGCAQILGLSDPSLGDIGADAAPPPDAKVVPDATPPITLTVTIDGDGVGKVTSNPTGISCPGTCSASFKAGATVRVTAAPNGGSSFGGFTPACGTEITCALTPTADTTVGVTFKDNSGGHNFVFGTSESYDPSTLSPLSVADANCNASAAAAGLPGTYVAWISTTGLSAKDRIPTTARGWVRPDGMPFGDRLTDILARKVYYPPRIDASGQSTDSLGAPVATGTDGSGSAVAGANCKAWTSPAAGDMYQAGEPENSTWTDGGPWGQCSQKARLYCFGTTQNKPVTITPTPGRVAFVSQKPLPIPLGGIANADAICAMEASNNGLPGTYKALLSMNGVAAASRFNDAGMPWVRRDGIPIAFPGSSLLDGGTLQVPIGQQASGTYVGVYRVAGGSTTLRDPGTADTTCNDWSVTDDSKHYLTAHGHVTRGWWASFSAPCTEVSPNLPVICLQE